MDLNASVISRVILFTDGAANVGAVTAPKDLLKLSKANQGIASASAFGYGADAQQDFLLSLAKQSNGNYAFVQNPDDALAAFGKELGGLLSTYASNLTIEVTPQSGHTITKVVSDVDAEEGDLGEVTIKISDILAEETRHIVLAVKMSEQKKAGPRAVNAASVKLGYDVLDDNLKRKREEASCTGKVQFVKAGEQTQSVSEELSKIVGLAEIVRAQIEAEEMADAGDYTGASTRMNFLAQDLNVRGLSSLGNTASSIGARVSSRNRYQKSSAYRASFARGATRSVGGTYDEEASADLSSYGLSLSTSSQDMVSNQFTADDVTVDPVSGDAVQPTSTSGTFTIGDSSGGYSPAPGSSDASAWASILVAPTVEPVEDEEPEVKEETPAPKKRRISQNRSKKSWR